MPGAIAPFNSEVMAIVAYAEVDADNPPAFVQNRGFAGITRNGSGDYTLDLKANEGLDDDIMGVFVQIKNATAIGFTAAEHVSNTQIRVRERHHDGATGIDLDFNIWVIRPAGVS